MTIKFACSSLPGTAKPFQCPLCGRRHVDLRSLKQHVKAAHPVPADEMRCVTTDGEQRR